MNTPEKLNYVLIQLPEGRKPDDVVGERHELVLLFDCAKSNPNGDPDTGNMPRVQPDSLKGLVTDVCLKRKIRNFFTLYCPHDRAPRPWRDEDGRKEDRKGYDIFIREGAVLQQLFDPQTKTEDARRIEQLAKEIFEREFGRNPEEWNTDKTGKGRGRSREDRPSRVAAGGEVTEEGTASKSPEGQSAKQAKAIIPAKEAKQRAFQLAILRTFFDLRAFGGVLSTEGPLKGSFYGQIRGPIQFTFAESLDKVLPLDATVTRCAVASVKEAEKAFAADSGDSRTMGRKYGIDYGLYRCHIHFSPAFAAKAGFTYYDFDNFLFALMHMFDDDHAAGRHLRLVGLVDFQHQSTLGNAPAHKVLDLVKVQGITEERDGKRVFKSSGSEFPRGLDDYCGEAPNGKLHVTRAGEIKPGENGEGVAVITASRLVWEIPAQSANGAST